MEQGGAPAGVGTFPTSQEARSPSAPDEGAAFNGWTGLDERRRQCRPDNVSGNALRSRPRSAEASSKIATAERRRARLPVTRQAAPSKVPDQDVAPDRRSPPSFEGGRK